MEKRTDETTRRSTEKRIKHLQKQVLETGNDILYLGNDILYLDNGAEETMKYFIPDSFLFYFSVTSEFTSPCDKDILRKYDVKFGPPLEKETKRKKRKHEDTK